MKIKGNQDPTASDSALTSRYEFAQRIAEEAGQLTLEFFGRNDLRVEWKADQSPVTIADRQAEQLLRSRIAEAFPDDAILGEEFPAKEGTSGFRWILDPIDGTKSFLCGVPLYGTLIGVLAAEQPAIGVIRLPALDESVDACIGHGAWHRRAGQVSAARVAEVDSLRDAVFVTSDRVGFTERQADQAAMALERTCRLSRSWGDCYGYALVATGRAHLMVDAALHVWDAAAVAPILTEAGGVFTDWKGVPTIHSGDGLGTTPGLLPSVLAILADA